ncbi:LLM class flavin-dependent oxidoreductase [Clavibacter michiganensis]|nr:LLM class flavin-dependent oxidoreductase [Clavibacter michiganensis]
MAQEIELGLDTFGDVTVGPDGRELPYAEVIRNVVAEGVLADQVGIDFIGLGEHHRDDYAISSPEVALAAIAAKTSRIRLGSAVTVLSSDDPVRVFQRFATLDAVSDGRAEVILGRGSFTESFPLFGYELSDYERLFEEKLGLFAELVKETPVTWSGSTRAGLTEHDVFPKTAAGIKTWVGVGGSPESVVRAARHGFPLMLAIIGGEPHRFAPYADLFARALDQLEQPRLPVGIHSPGYVGETDAEAREAFFPDYQVMHARIGKDRGWPPLARASYEQEIEHGSLYVGSPETVARKIAATLKAVGATRFDLKYSAGPFSHERMMGGIERYGTVVAPMVRDLLA